MADYSVPIHRAVKTGFYPRAVLELSVLEHLGNSTEVVSVMLSGEPTDPNSVLLMTVENGTCTNINPLLPISNSKIVPTEKIMEEAGLFAGLRYVVSVVLTIIETVAMVRKVLGGFSYLLTYDYGLINLRVVEKLEPVRVVSVFMLN